MLRPEGFAAASMADIVKEADLSAGAVYVYYSSKSELMFDAGRQIMEQRLSVFDDLATAADVPPPQVVFPRLLNAMLDDNPFAPLVIQVWAEAVHTPEFADLASTIFAEVRAVSRPTSARTSGSRSARPRQTRQTAPAAALLPCLR